MGSLPVNQDYKYSVKERKRIPTSKRLGDEMTIKFADFETNGRRIFILGTVETSPSHVFLAIFNTRYNLTEFVWDEESAVNERGRGLEIDTGNDQCNLLLAKLP